MPEDRLNIVPLDTQLEIDDIMQFSGKKSDEQVSMFQVGKDTPSPLA